MPALFRGSERLNLGWRWESYSSSALSSDGLREGWSVASHPQSCSPAPLLSRGMALGELLSLPSPGSASVGGPRGSAAERTKCCSDSTGKGEAVCGSSLSFSRGEQSALANLEEFIIALGFTGGSDGKGFTCNAGDLGSVPGSGRSPREGKGLPTPVLLPGEFHGQRSLVGYSPWIAKSQTRLSN